jgi:hypothetical protein
MALLKTGSLITDLNGKLGGQSFQRSRQGLTLQNSPGHINKINNNTTSSRAYAKRFYSGWRSLTDDQRMAWRSRALITSYTNVFGNSYKLTGFMLYVKSNILITLCGISPINIPGNFSPALALTSIIITIVSGVSISVAFTVTPLNASNRLFIYASYPVSKGISFNSKILKLVYISPASASSPEIITSPYLSTFGILPVTGQRVFFSAFIFHTVSALKSATISIARNV